MSKPLRSTEFLDLLGVVDTTPRFLRVDDKVLARCSFCKVAEKLKAISSLKSNLDKLGYAWRCQDCAKPFKSIGAKKPRRSRKTHTREELEQFGLIDTTSRPISKHDAVLVRCHGCVKEQAYRSIVAIRDSFRRHNFGYQCVNCFAKKIKNRSPEWLENVRKSSRTQERVDRAAALGKKKIKYSPEQIEAVINASGAVLLAGDISSPSNVVTVGWPDGLQRKIRIRRFMVNGRVDKPKIKHLNQNKKRFLDAVKTSGLSVEMLGPKLARVNYRGQSWEQRWVNTIDNRCTRMMRKIDIGHKIDELVKGGMSLQNACHSIGVSPVTYYRRRKLGYNPVESVVSIRNSERLISLEGAVYNKLLIGTSYRPDLLIPDRKLIIEVDGLHWHSEEKKAKDYHFKRAETFLGAGYSVLAFTELEVKEKNSIITSMIQHKLKKSLYKIGARSCQIGDLSRKEANDFFQENHLKGAGSGRCIGLRYAGVVVAAIRIINVDPETINISRFACRNCWSVPGSYSRLLAALPNKRIINFVDRRHGTGEHLLSLGFEKRSVHIGFEWTDGYVAYNRMTFLGNSGYDHGFLRVYDYGQIKYVREKNTP